ncbi:hypothetical protein CDD80_1473 [Ophiocordyceps camponoti-rufipedis]|uniref:Uncharacterized protein n=1 Tax=Ophiocordyceps camponoti-rufipedis TaxID=2004952 RepID=A0A2C5ZKV0_9HYPO|nr:hypothetical protein CDD80_1473 [Ophiocordyceps camponoti-rufipedis]
MASAAKTVVATGVSSGLGFEAVKQLLSNPQPYRVILGARRVDDTKSALDALGHNRAVTVLPLDLADVRQVKTFARAALDVVGKDPIDYLLLNAGIIKNADEGPSYKYKWCEAAVVNHFSQHYLIHLLREKLVASKSRVVVVSSGAIRNVPDTTVLPEHLKADSGVAYQTIYADTKFVQLLGAHWWRRQLANQCHVVAVSPGLIPSTGLGRSTNFEIPKDNPDAKTVPQGAQSILAAFTRSDFPDDPDRIFLTSWGEWWGKDVFEKSLDKGLQDSWCPGQEELEKELGV